MNLSSNSKNAGLFIVSEKYARLYRYSEATSTDLPRYCHFESLFLISIGNFLKINSDGDRLKVLFRSTPEATDIPRPAVQRILI